MREYRLKVQLGVGFTPTKNDTSHAGVGIESPGRATVAPLINSHFPCGSID